jgi:hypothetical protein
MSTRPKGVYSKTRRPLLPQKRTFYATNCMSALGQKQTWPCGGLHAVSGKLSTTKRCTIVKERLHNHDGYGGRFRQGVHDRSSETTAITRSLVREKVRILATERRPALTAGRTGGAAHIGEIRHEFVPTNASALRRPPIFARWLLRLGRAKDPRPSTTLGLPGQSTHTVTHRVVCRVCTVVEILG